MLFSYKPINHDIEALHRFLEHTVLEVCCKPDGDFDISMLHPDFQQIVKSIPTYLHERIEKIYEICSGLSKDDLAYIADAFHANNSIKELCEGSVTPVFYRDIGRVSDNLKGQLKVFCKDLYEHVIDHRKTFTNEYKSLKEFYKEFVSRNNKGKCPFCGLNSIKSKLLTKRDAFDHYLPKSLLPFNSVNLLNIAPACDDCNSVWKLAKNPIIDSGGNRRKAFFPYTTREPQFDIIIDIEYLDPNDCDKNELDIQINSVRHREEVNTWREVYGIDERYNERCCYDAKYWLIQALDEAANYKEQQSIDDEIKKKENYPLSEYNFLRVPFLKAYKRYSTA
ncbi:MAG: hypothetical protein ACXAC5_22265 [Promethearchaeota archaeon]|jgi:hypothetical protein